MRIFFITSKLNFTSAGGSIEEFDLIIRMLQKWGHEVTVITAFSKANDLTVSLPYTIIEENISARGLVGIQYGIYQLLKKYAGQADLFHVDGHLFLYGAGLFRWLGGRVPVSAYFNREQPSWPELRSSLFSVSRSSLFKRLKRTMRWHIEKYFLMPIASQIDRMSFISPHFKIEYEKAGLKTAGKSVVVGDPIDLKKIRHEQGITERYYLKRNKRGGPFTIFYSSRMAPGKGFDVLLTGFSKVRNKSNFKLILGGSGPEEQYVKQMIHNLKLEPYVELPGWVDKEKLFAYHHEADIFIQADWLPYGTSISLLYALTFCLPCIVFGDSGLEWIAGKAALYFPYRDSEALARQIERLGASYQLREELARAAWRRLNDDDFNFEHQIRKMYAGMGI